jgi:hypothetical protein
VFICVPIIGGAHDAITSTGSAIGAKGAIWRPAEVVHHTNYRCIGSERPEDLLALCVECHEGMHPLPKAANDNDRQLSLPFEDDDDAGVARPPWFQRFASKNASKAASTGAEAP